MRKTILQLYIENCLSLFLSYQLFIAFLPKKQHLSLVKNFNSPSASYHYCVVINIGIKQTDQIVQSKSEKWVIYCCIAQCRVRSIGSNAGCKVWQRQEGRTCDTSPSHTWGISVYCWMSCPALWKWPAGGGTTSPAAMTASSCFLLPCVELEVVLLVPVHKVLNRFSVGSVTPVPDEANDSRVISELL